MTLATEEIFSRFDGPVAEGKALAYGHSYTGNALGCAAATASLEVFEKENVLEKLQPKIEEMRAGLAKLQGLPGVSEVRQCGLLTRPIRDVVVLMPPLCITAEQLTVATGAIHDSILEVCER